jgi:hypothetical protein
MATIKNTPRYLNTDSDERVLQTTEMSDALNVRITAEDNGDAGVVKNVDGNTFLGALGNATAGSTNKIVGTYEHEGTNRFFVFVHGSLGTHTVYKLEQGSSTFTKIIESADILLSGEPLHIDGMVIDEELHLYFTDGVEKPQKINVDTSEAVGSYPSSQNEASVMKPSPFAPIVSYSTDLSKKSNDIAGKSFQFALQYVYRDGEVSAIGEYSENTVGFNTLNNGFDGAEYDSNLNKIEVQIGGGTLGMGLGSTIPNLRLFFRDVYDNTMYYVGEYSYTELFNGVDFYNDGSYSVVSDAEHNKLQDAVPKTAKAQTITANRLFYGNYTEGFNKPTLTPTLAAVLDSSLETPRMTESTAYSPTTVSIDTSDVEKLIDGSTDIETITKFKMAKIGLNPDISTSSTHDIELREKNGALIGTDTVAVNLGLGTADIFKSKTITAPTDISNFRTKLATALNNETFEVAVEATHSTTITVSSTTYLLFFAGTATLSINASATSTGIDITFGLESFNVNAARITDGSVNLDDKKASLSVTSGITVGSSAVQNWTTEDGQSVAYIAHDNQTFKAGEAHSFGVVFEDEYGRTTGVQELGSVYIPTLGERNTDELGSASVDISFIASGLDSDLTRFFYVYSGGNSIEDYIQYSVGHAYVVDDANNEAGNSKAIYLGLRTLQGKDQSYSGGDGGADLTYSFTEGDKLRILSYKDGDSTIHPKDYIFDVVGLTTLDANIFPSGHGHSDFESTGDFLLLKNASYSNFNRDAVDADTDLWDSECIVEIYTPKKEQTTKIYRAIEGKYEVSTDIGNTHNVKQGNAWYKQRNIKFTNTSDETLSDNLRYVESSQYSDYDKSTKGDLGGKPYAVINNEREHHRISSLTYSEPQLADSAQTNLSSFNNSLANFADYEMNYGGIFGLCDMSDSIMMLQSDKVSRIPVSRQILTTGTGSEFVTQSVDILGLQQHYSGNFGINENRTAFLNDDGTVYLVDVTRSKIVAITQQGVKILNDLGVDSWINDRTSSMLEDANGYFVSVGIDKDNDEVYFSLQNLPLASYSESIVYSKQLDKFTSKSSVAAPYFGTLGLRFFSFRDDDSWEQNTNNTKGNFYGSQEDSYFEVSFNQSPSLNKVFHALSIEGTADADVEVTTSNNQNLTIPQESFKLREGEYYTKVGRSDSDFNKIVIGKVASINGDNVTFYNRVNRIPFRLGGDAFVQSGSTYTSVAGTSVSGVVDAYTLSFVNASNLSADTIVAISGEGVIDGEPMRGSYATGKFTFDDTDTVEVFAVNASVAESNLHNSNTSQ